MLTLHLKLITLLFVYIHVTFKKSSVFFSKEVVLRKVLDLNRFMEGFLDDVLEATVTLHKLRIEEKTEICTLGKKKQKSCTTA